MKSEVAIHCFKDIVNQLKDLGKLHNNLKISKQGSEVTIQIAGKKLRRSLIIHEMTFQVHELENYENHPKRAFIKSHANIKTVSKIHMSLLK